MKASDVVKLFGTDGIRGEAGIAPLDAPTVEALGHGLATLLAARTPRAPRVLVGRDTRQSGPEILAWLSRGLAEGGATTVSAGVLPTPGVSYLTRTGSFDAGVVISASHNAWRDNGLKIFSSAGAKLPDDDEARLEADVARRMGAARPRGEHAGPEDDDALADLYEDWLVSRAAATGAPYSRLAVVVDGAFGAAFRLGPRALARAGCRVTAIHDAPDGRNINEGAGSLHPETLAEAVRAAGADAGVAFDGDADRAILVDEAGAVVDGDHVLWLIASDLLTRGRLRGGGVVGTVMSNLGLEQALASRGATLVRERVGDRNVLERMTLSGYNVGGEPSGHVILLDESPTGDGILAALHVLAVLARAEVPLSRLAATMPRCPQVLRNVRVRARVPLQDVPGHAALVETWAARLGGSGRMLVRYSGTENLVRVMVEGRDEALVVACADALSSHLASALGAG